MSARLAARIGALFVHAATGQNWHILSFNRKPEACA